jgi:hypothetical protein
MDTANSQFQDGKTGTFVDPALYWKSAAVNFGTPLTKQAKWINAQVVMGLGGSLNLCLYKDLAATPLVSKALVGASPRILSTMSGTAGTYDVSLATYLVDEMGGLFKNARVNFEFKFVQVGMTNILSNNSRVDIDNFGIEAAMLKR